MLNQKIQFDGEPSKLEKLVSVTQGIQVVRYQGNDMNYRLVSPRHLDGFYLKADLDAVALSKVNLKKYQLHANDIVMTIKYKIGKASLVTEDIEGSLADQNLAILHCIDTSKVLPRYLVAIINSEWFFQYQLSPIMGLSTVTSISLSQLRNLKVPVPDQHTQKKIADLFFTLEEIKTSSLKALEIRQKLAESSLFELFGENV
ncbi:MAG: restriction endonuclease subunit S [Pseudanabaena sp.]|jgi:restriction endonuclease S subunit